MISEADLEGKVEGGMWDVEGADEGYILTGRGGLAAYQRLGGFWSGAFVVRISQSGSADGELAGSAGGYIIISVMAGVVPTVIVGREKGVRSVTGGHITIIRRGVIGLCFGWGRKGGCNRSDEVGWGGG